MQELVVDAHVYLRWVLGAAARNAALSPEPIVTSARGARLGGLKTTPPQKKTLKIGPLKTRVPAKRKARRRLDCLGVGLDLLGLWISFAAK